MEDPYEDVPDHLYPHLWQWIVGSVWGNSGALASRMGGVAMALRITLNGPSNSEKLAHLKRLCNDQGFMLDTTDVILELWQADSGRARALKRVLAAANSAYTVNDAQDGLEEVAPRGVKLAVAEAIDAAPGSAGDHLVEAWNQAYGRNPDPVKAYSESVKAAEAALAEHVSPDNQVQTLGSMIRDISAKPSKWSVVTDGTNARGVEGVLAMMRALWEGQTSRHGGKEPTTAETLDQARVAVHLSATLVHFGTSGAFAAAP